MKHTRIHQIFLVGSSCFLFGFGSAGQAADFFTTSDQTRFAEEVAKHYQCKDGQPVAAAGESFQGALQYQLCVDRRFSSKDMDILRRAFEILLARANDSVVRNCLRPYWTKNVFTAFDGAFAATLGVPGISFQTMPYVFLSRRDEPKRSWGRLVEIAAGLDDSELDLLAKTAPKFLAFAFNADALSLADLPFHSDPNVWASLMGMAYLQQLPTQTIALRSWRALGQCLRWNGSIPTEFREPQEIGK